MYVCMYVYTRIYTYTQYGLSQLVDGSHMRQYIYIYILYIYIHTQMHTCTRRHTHHYCRLSNT